MRSLSGQSIPDQPIAATATATITATTEAAAPIDELLQKLDVHEAQVESGATESAEPIELAPLDIEKESDESFDELLGMMVNDAEEGAAADTESDDEPEFDGSPESEPELEPEPEPEPEPELEPEAETETESRSQNQSQNQSQSQILHSKGSTAMLSSEATAASSRLRAKTNLIAI